MHKLITGHTISNNETITFHLNPVFLEHELVNEDLWLTIEGQDFHTVPKHLLYIPAILNLAPVIWANNLHVVVAEIDEKFSESLNTLHGVFKKLYPNIPWNGSISFEDITKYPEDRLLNKSCVLFSGGVDSVNTSLSHLDEPQILVTIQGADIPLHDSIGWEIVKEQTQEYAQQHDLEYVYIISNFVSFLNHTKLDAIDPSIPNWWGYVQHGMGLSGLAISLCNKLYIASSYSDYTAWGSHPEIDNNIICNDFKVIHDSYPMTREEKILNIVQKTVKANEPPMLRVCYRHDSKGENCCRCEKCLRTISGLVCAGEKNYQDYGFALEPEEVYKEITKGFQKNKFDFSVSTHLFWEDIREHLKSIDTYKTLGYKDSLLNLLNWIALYDFNKYSQHSQLRTQRKLLWQKYLNQIKKPLQNNKYILNFYLDMKTLIKGNR